jgi:hypothetical protein
LLLVLTGAIGLAAELVLTEHWHDWWQCIPFTLCLLVSIASVMCLTRPGPTATRITRAIAVLTVIGALVGVGQHLWANGTFTAEIRPSYTLSQLIIPALVGASPALADCPMSDRALTRLLPYTGGPPFKGDRNGQDRDREPGSHTGQVAEG